MEIMRAVVALVDPEAQFVNLENVHFRSPLKIFKDEPFEAEVELVRIQIRPAKSGRIMAGFSLGSWTSKVER